MYLTLFIDIFITYGIISWGGAYDNNLQLLKKYQHSIKIRVVCHKDWRFPTKKLFEEFKELNINNLLLYKNLFNMSKKT